MALDSERNRFHPRGKVACAAVVLSKREAALNPSQITRANFFRIVYNFVSGLILLWERTIRVGDWIVHEGFVRRINVRSTEIETYQNSSLIAGVVKNLVRNDRTGRVVIPIAVPGTANPEKVREVLLEIAIPWHNGFGQKFRQSPGPAIKGLVSTTKKR